MAGPVLIDSWEVDAAAGRITVKGHVVNPTPGVHYTFRGKVFIPPTASTGTDCRSCTTTANSEFTCVFNVAIDNFPEANVRIIGTTTDEPPVEGSRVIRLQRGGPGTTGQVEQATGQQGKRDYGYGPITFDDPQNLDDVLDQFTLNVTINVAYAYSLVASVTCAAHSGHNGSLSVTNPSPTSTDAWDVNLTSFCPGHHLVNWYVSVSLYREPGHLFQTSSTIQVKLNC